MGRSDPAKDESVVCQPVSSERLNLEEDESWVGLLDASERLGLAKDGFLDDQVFSWTIQVSLLNGWHFSWLAEYPYR